MEIRCYIDGYGKAASLGMERRCTMNGRDLNPPMRPDKSSDQVSGCWLRWSLLAFGWANVGLGLVGVFVPGLPTTVFLLIAFWAFSKSSARFQTWLWEHPRLGPPIRDWHEHRVIPLKAKILAAVMMTSSFVYVAFFVAESWVFPAVLAAIMVPAAVYVLSRASAPPDDAVLQPVRIDDETS